MICRTIKRIVVREMPIRTQR